MDVALNLPIDRTFLYKVPCRLSKKVSIGKRVVVPFGKNDLLKTGIIIGINRKLDGINRIKIKEVFDVPDRFRLLDDSTLKLYRFISDYYCASFGETLFHFIPSGFSVSESFYVRVRQNRTEVKLTNAEQKIIEAFKGSKAKVKLSSLMKRLGSNAYMSIRNLISKGILEKEEFLKPDTIPKEKFVYLKQPITLEKPKEAQLLEMLSKGDMPYKKLVKLGFGYCIKKLIKKEVLGIKLEEVSLKNKPQEFKDKRDVELTPSQVEAFSGILNNRGAFLLSGVTGSGKMEVYLQVAREYVKKGKAVLILVPELLLTPYLRARVESYFGDNITIYHSALTKRQKVSSWIKALKGETKVFIGTRSAIGLPIKDLGLIIVDEEQDESYKEQQKPYYNARDVAIKRGKLEDIPVILVSASPSVKTYYMARKGLIKSFYLKERVTVSGLPVVKLIDMRKAEKVSIFSKELLTAIENTIKRHGQVLLFINRRGFFSNVFCPNCGKVLECERCSIPLTYHSSDKKLICHMCGKSYPPIYRCPECGSRLKFGGYGTERVEKELKFILPDIRIVRLDQDTIRNSSIADKTIKDITEGNCDCIIGTQIAIKGHNFPNLTLVGILMADILYGAPDYRASERIFHSIVHATGRAGRFKAGAALVQAFNPDLPAIRYAIDGDMNSFYSEELSSRQLFNYPPFLNLVLVEFRIGSLSSFKSLSKRFELAKDKFKDLASISPLMPAPISKLSGMYRFISLFRVNGEKNVCSLNRLIRREFPKIFKNVKYKVDVDPVRIV